MVNLPDIGNLQHISDHYKLCAMGIVNIHNRGDPENLVSMKNERNR